MTLIADLGKALWGEAWVDHASIILAINRRTVQRWANGQNATPGFVLERLLELAPVELARRAAAVDRIAERVSTAQSGEAKP